MPTLPISNLLREATPENIRELYSRPVEGMEDSDVLDLIRAYRSNRERLAALAAAAPTPRQKVAVQKESPELKMKVVPAGLKLRI